MDADITNVGVDAIFIPGPNLNLAPGETKTWSGISVADMDGNATLKTAVVAGTVTVSLTPDASDAAQANQGALNIGALPIYTYAALPTGYDGAVVYCSNGRKTGELGGAGTGVPAYYSAGAWHVFYDDSVLAI